VADQWHHGCTHPVRLIAMRLVPTLTTSLLAIASTLLVVDHANAAPPAGESFDILYYLTDENGDRSRQFTSYDLQGYVNKARCECGQSVSARIRIGNDATDLDSVQIRTFVGNNCDTAVSNPNGMYRPCPVVYDAFTNAYTRNVDIEFHPLWLATGVSGDSSYAIDDAIANANCDSGQGNGGIWMCIENGMATDCQADEFIVKGTQNLNAGMEEQMGIRFDFTPPIVTVDSPKVSSGDGALEISWKNTSSGAIDGGFRILCATADGQPVPGKGFELSTVTAQNRGTIYFTKENLCPDGPFSEVMVTDDPGEIPGGGETGGGSDSGSDSGDGETGLDTSGGIAFGDEPDPQHGGTSSCCAPNVSAGCDNVGCEARVCEDELDPCCTDGWSQQCADEALAECFVCGGATTCCTATGSPGCGDDACMQQVCLDSPECCKVAWNAACVSAAQLACDACMDDSTTGDTATSTDVTTTPTTVTATDGSTDTDGTASGTDTDTGGNIDSPIENLDWAFVCSSYIAPAASSARINGLQNGTEYHVMIVAYDKAGNPAVASPVLTAIPRETTDLWEQCEQQGGICGEGGFCNCTASESTPDDDAQWLLVLALFGLRRRRRAA
jgi:hypothetical protein